MSDNRSHVAGRRTVLKTAGAAGTAAVLGPLGPAGADRSAAEFVVKKRGAVGMGELKSSVPAALPAGSKLVHENEVLGYVTVEVPIEAVEAEKELVASLERWDGVAYAERNVTYRALGATGVRGAASTAPDDPRFDEQYVPQQVNAPEAWERTRGEDAVLSVVDQGIDYEHEDLRDRFGSTVGYDFVEDDEDPMPVAPSESHGTYVAGLAAATTDNGTGIAGVSDAQLLSARALDENGGGSLQDIVDAIQWSADRGADVVALPLGAPNDADLMRDAIDYAVEAGSLPVASAGGDPATVMYPAAYDDCVAVAAIDEYGRAAEFTGRGPEIDVCAGGVDVLSTVPDDGYDLRSGTSMATAAAAGVACLGASANDLTGDDRDPGTLRELLEETAAPVEGLPDEVEGEGLVDAAEIVGDGPSECGQERTSATAEGSLRAGWWGDGDRYTYALETVDPCEATITLESTAGFDLYVTLDGRTPTRWDHDEASTGDGNERIDLELDGDEELGVLVRAEWFERGDYVLEVEELGRGPQ